MPKIVVSFSEPSIQKELETIDQTIIEVLHLIDELKRLENCGKDQLLEKKAKLEGPWKLRYFVDQYFD